MRSRVGELATPSTPTMIHLMRTPQSLKRAHRRGPNNDGPVHVLSLRLMKKVLRSRANATREQPSLTALELREPLAPRPQGGLRQNLPNAPTP